MGTDRIAELTDRRDRLITRRDNIRLAADSLARDADAFDAEVGVLSRELASLTPIENTVAWIPSTTRVGSHLTVVINGEGFCTCEDARYRNPEGGCKHFNEAIARKYHDSRAVFKGGFDGPVTTDPAVSKLLETFVEDVAAHRVFHTTVN
jgi:hypothetical protein